MKKVFELAKLIEASKRSLFNQGWTYEEADEMVRIVFEETGLKFHGFFELYKDDVQKAIDHLKISFEL